jgi:hypothetical protein
MITAFRLKELMLYDKETGKFFWLSTSRNKGVYAGWCDTKGYIRIQVEGRTYAAHRLAWLYVYGRWPAGQIDHINRIPYDNRIVNLRECTNAENQENTVARITSKTGIKGIYPNSARTAWRVKYKQKYIGTFKTIEEAIIALEKEKAKWHLLATS